MSDKFQWGEAGKLIPAADEAVTLQSCREKLPRLVAPFNPAREPWPAKSTPNPLVPNILQFNRGGSYRATFP